MLALGTPAALAFSMAVRSWKLPAGSAPALAATMISRPRRVNTAPRRASTTALVRLIWAHLLWPAIVVWERRGNGEAGRPWNSGPGERALARWWTRLCAGGIQPLWKAAGWFSSCRNGACLNGASQSCAGVSRLRQRPASAAAVRCHRRGRCRPAGHRRPPRRRPYRQAAARCPPGPGRSAREPVRAR